MPPSKSNNEPILKAFLALSASCSRPKGVMNGDFEFSAAAIVSAGSRQRNKAATRRNLPRCTSVGNLLRRRPIGVISSVDVSAPTSINAVFARWMFTDDGGSRLPVVSCQYYQFRIEGLVKRTSQDVFDRGPEVDLQDLDSQGKIR